MIKCKSMVIRTNNPGRSLSPIGPTNPPKCKKVMILTVAPPVMYWKVIIHFFVEDVNLSLSNINYALFTAIAVF